jgi:hypothetical protein
MVAIHAEYLDLLQQKTTFAHLATIMPDGTPQVTPGWFDYTDGKVRVNSRRACAARSVIARAPDSRGHACFHSSEARFASSRGAAAGRAAVTTILPSETGDFRAIQAVDLAGYFRLAGTRMRGQPLAWLGALSR